MSRINRVPFGLQSLLDSKNFGVNPSELAETTIPTLEIQKFLESSLLRSQTESDQGVAIGANVNVTVPSGEIWQPIAIAMDFLNLFNAGGFARGELAYFLKDDDIGAATIRPIAYGPDWDAIIDATSTATGYGFAYHPAYPYFLPGGTQIRATIIDAVIPGASVTFSLNVTYLKFEI